MYSRWKYKCSSYVTMSIFHKLNCLLALSVIYMVSVQSNAIGNCECTVSTSVSREFYLLELFVRHITATFSFITVVTDLSSNLPFAPYLYRLVDTPSSWCNKHSLFHNQNEQTRKNSPKNGRNMKPKKKLFFPCVRWKWFIKFQLFDMYVIRTCINTANFLH